MVLVFCPFRIGAVLPIFWTPELPWAGSPHEFGVQNGESGALEPLNPRGFYSIWGLGFRVQV